MEDILVAVRSTTSAGESFISEAADQPRSTNLGPGSRVIASDQLLPDVPLMSADHATEILRSKPSFEQLVNVLRFLDWEASNVCGFDVRIPCSQAAQMVTILVSDTLPAYWSVLNEESHHATPKKRFKHPKERERILQCLRTLPALGAILARIKVLNDASKTGKKEALSIRDDLALLLEILDVIMEAKSFIRDAWSGLTAGVQDSTKRLSFWKEFTSLVASGRLLSVAAEAVSLLNDTDSNVGLQFWFSDGRNYSSWLGRQMTTIALSFSPGTEDDWKAAGLFLGRSLSLGYQGLWYSSFCCYPCLPREFRSGCWKHLFRTASARDRTLATIQASNREFAQA
jgi:telomere length regulation protein